MPTTSEQARRFGEVLASRDWQRGEESANYVRTSGGKDVEKCQLRPNKQNGLFWQVGTSEGGKKSANYVRTRAKARSTIRRKQGW